MGGVVGRITAPGARTVTRSVNNGRITGTTYVGGIVRTITGYMASAEECVNNETVAAQNYAAGIPGYSEAGEI